jgi:hypothetical protein
MSSYKTTSEVQEEARKDKSPNPYLQGTWAWVEFEKARANYHE